MNNENVLTNTNVALLVTFHFALPFFFLWSMFLQTQTFDNSLIKLIIYLITVSGVISWIKATYKIIKQVTPFK